MTAAHRRQKPREETEARLLRERGTPEERIGPVVPDGTLYPQSESAANKLRIALQVREAMREHRRGKPVAFQPSWRPPRSSRG